MSKDIIITVTTEDDIINAKRSDAKRVARSLPPKKEINYLCSTLKKFFMGELIPPTWAIAPECDRDCDPNCVAHMWEDHSCVECNVEFIPVGDPRVKYFGENMLLANIRYYVGNGKYMKMGEYWRAADVACFQ